jgi:dTMP kinase
VTARGRFISFEGGEGAGKTTHVRRLAARLQARGIAVVATREPGGTPAGEAIRGLLLTGSGPSWSALSEALLHYAARREHVDHLIEPALARGSWVVCDRFADSTMAYQGYGLGVDRGRIAALHRLVLGDFGPDLSVVLDLPAEVGAARARARVAGGAGAGGAADRYEAMDLAFHARIREGFLAIAAAEPGRCVVIDARLAVAEIDRAIDAAVSRHLQLPTVSLP